MSVAPEHAFRLRTDCPSCGTGHVSVTAQVLVDLGMGVLEVEPATTDDFVSAACDNRACTHRLEQEPGDGRLRRSELLDGDELLDDANLLARWHLAAEEVIDRHAASSAHG